MSGMTDIKWTSTTAKLGNLKPWGGNPKTSTGKQHDQLTNSFDELGQFQTVAISPTGDVYDGHQRLSALLAKHGKDYEVQALQSSRPLTEQERRKIAIYSRQIGAWDWGALSSWDAGELMEWGFDEDLLKDWGQDYSALSAMLESEETFEKPEGQPNPRNLPIDFIYTATFPASCCIAAAAGVKYGIQSGKKLCPNCGVMANHDLLFIDNDYFDYNHERHLSDVVNHKPKYATVMDVMTSDQCKKDGIKYRELAQILDWAEELNEHAENVIVIPKYDCLDRIPDKFMLGYSVPTSHGGTPLPPESFAGRRVHLLGGSWKNQLAHMAVLGDDVVSLDNNYQGNIAQVGGCVLPDGTRKDLKDYGIDTRVNPAYIALSISIGNMAWKINELYAVEEPAKE